MVSIFGIEVSKDVGKSIVARQGYDAGAFALTHALHAAKVQLSTRTTLHLRNNLLCEPDSATRTDTGFPAITARQTDRQNWGFIKHKKTKPKCNVATLHSLIGSAM